MIYAVSSKWVRIPRSFCREIIHSGYIMNLPATVQSLFEEYGSFHGVCVGKVSGFSLRYCERVRERRAYCQDVAVWNKDGMDKKDISSRNFDEMLNICVKN